MCFDRWIDAVAFANARAQVTYRRQTVFRHRIGWVVTQ